ncbi:MAG TPA: DMT family transporter [Bryobacteraceae bacterium]|nr:DMT family transporter [Bryobacteraceae bacterium]
MTDRTKNRLLLLAAAVSFSTGGALIKSSALNGWQVSGLRSGIAALALYLFLPQVRRVRNWRLLPVGFAYASMLILYVISTKLTTAANAIFLQSTAPLYLLLLSPLLLHERIRRGDVVFMMSIAAGLALFFVGTEPPLASAPDPKTGNFLGAASGLAWALTLAGLRWLGRSDPAGNVTLAPVLVGNALAFLVCLPMGLPLYGFGVKDAAIVLYLGIIQIGLSYVLLTRAIRHVPAFEAATILLAEPALNPVWAWMVHGERPGPWPLAGGIVILTATLVHTHAASRRPAAG